MYHWDWHSTRNNKLGLQHGKIVNLRVVPSSLPRQLDRCYIEEVDLNSVKQLLSWCVIVKCPHAMREYGVFAVWNNWVSGSCSWQIAQLTLGEHEVATELVYGISTDLHSERDSKSPVARFRALRTRL